MLLRLNKWVPLDGIEQTATTWQIARDINFTDLLVDERSDTKINLAIYDVIVPIGVVYYTRAMRHFDNSANDFWTPPKEIINTNDTENAILINGDIIIDQPMIYLTKEDVLNDSKTITIRTSKFRGTDGHVSTCWFIMDGTDKVLFHKLYDTDNLESITIPKEYNLRNSNMLKVIAIHVSTLGVESPVGVLNITLANNTFEITSILEQVIPLKEYTLTFIPLVGYSNHNIENIKLLDETDTEIYSTIVNDTTMSIVIPWYLLIPNSSYKLEIIARNTIGDITSTFRNLNTQTGKITDIENININYSKQVAEINKIPNVFIPNGLVSEELGNNIILSPIYGNQHIHKLEYDKITNTYVNKGAIYKVSLLNTKNDNTYIKILPGGNIFIDTYTIDDKPIFLLYDYNKATDNASLLTSKVRLDETTPLGKTNSIIWISDTEFIYCTYGSNILKKYNIITTNITELGAIPLPDVLSVVLLRLKGNRILIIGGSDFTNKIYDIEDNIFLDGATTSPGSFINRDLKSIRLINGDYIVFKTDYLVTDLDNSILYFTYETGKFEEVEYKYLKDKAPATSIKLLSGQVILTRYNYKEQWEDKDNEFVALLLS